MNYAFDGNTEAYERCLDACAPKPAPVNCLTCPVCDERGDACDFGCLITYLYDSNQKNYNDCLSWCS